VLAEEGFKYDSSIYPIKGKRYGWPGFSKKICKIDLPSGKSIIEVPMSTITILNKAFPVAGGGYIRHFPFIVTKFAVKFIEKNRPAIVYMHPYEIETSHRTFPITDIPLEDRSRVLKHRKLQLRNRHTMPLKINRLLSLFNFAPLKTIISENLETSLE
jgi:hypothetical protein